MAKSQVLYKNPLDFSLCARFIQVCDKQWSCYSQQISTHTYFICAIVSNGKNLIATTVLSMNSVNSPNLTQYQLTSQQFEFDL